MGVPLSPAALAAVCGSLSVLLAGSAVAASGDPPALVRGMTISCQTNGREWATPGFAAECERLAALGVTWVAIHPYARIHGHGAVTWRAWTPDSPPAHVVQPIADAQALGLAILVKPHLSYWGSPFSWRGAIDFDDPSERALFFETYTEWIVALAHAAQDADAFCVGTELDRLLEAADEPHWRALIARVREVTDARLVYAANWTDFERVPFWDALDAVGVQAYFPLTDAPDPSEAELRAGWQAPLERLRALHAATGKPVVFTELGYDASPGAAREPWVGKPWHGFGHSAERTSGREERDLQERCLALALEVLAREREWLRGAFLWKWFVGPAPGEDFVLDTPRLTALLRARWGGATER